MNLRRSIGSESVVGMAELSCWDVCSTGKGQPSVLPSDLCKMLVLCVHPLPYLTCFKWFVFPDLNPNQYRWVEASLVL